MVVTLTEGPMMTLRSLTTGLLALTVVLSGCSAMRVSTNEGDSAPVKVGVGDGSTSTPSAESGVGAIPPGMTEQTIDVGQSCPVPIAIAMDDEWSDSTGYDGYRLFERGPGALMTVNCYEDDDITPADVVKSAQDTTFDSAGSQMSSEETGQVTGGEYWTFTGTLGPDDMRSVESSESLIYGVAAGVQVEGRQFKVTLEMVVKSEDQATADVFATMLPTVRLADENLTPPPGLN